MDTRSYSNRRTDDTDKDSNIPYSVNNADIKRVMLERSKLMMNEMQKSSDLLSPKLQKKISKSIEEFCAGENCKWQAKAFAWVFKNYTSAKEIIQTLIVFAVVDEALHHNKKEGLMATKDKSQCIKDLQNIIEGAITETSEKDSLLIQYAKTVVPPTMNQTKREKKLFNWLLNTSKNTEKELRVISILFHPWICQMQKKGLDIYQAISDSQHYAMKVQKVLKTHNIDTIVELFSENGGRSYWLTNYIAPTL